MKKQKRLAEIGIGGIYRLKCTQKYVKVVGWYSDNRVAFIRVYKNTAPTHNIIIYNLKAFSKRFSEAKNYDLRGYAL